MANVLNGNTYFVDTVSTDASSCLESKDVKMIGLIYTTTANNQSFTLNDIASVTGSNAPTVGAKKVASATDLAYTQNYYDFSANPIRFPNGIWVSALGTGTLTLILKFN